jgi:hypothetical protein
MGKQCEFLFNNNKCSKTLCQKRINLDDAVKIPYDICCLNCFLNCSNARLGCSNNGGLLKR